MKNSDFSPSSSFAPQVLNAGFQKSYMVLKTLGQGGYGVVYQVKDPFSERTMALKILLLSHAQNPLVKERFLREIKILSNLEHPNIIPVYESGVLLDGTLYFTMKELKGFTMKELLARAQEGKPSFQTLGDFLEIFSKVCDAVQYASSKGVVHRDLKPSNIAIGDFGEVFVLDWGVSKQILDASSLTPTVVSMDPEKGLTSRKTMLGTPGYMSPEQARGEEADTRSDVFSLGAILYEILTFAPPFGGTPQAKLVGTLTKDPVPPHESRPDLSIPQELSAIAMKALNKKKEDRYATPLELKRDLMRYQGGFGVSAKQDRFHQKIFRWIRRNKGLSLGISAFFFALLIGAFFFQWIEQEGKKKKIGDYLQQMAKMELQIKDLKKSLHWGKDASPFFQEESIYLRTQREEVVKLYGGIRSLLERARELSPENPNLLKKLYWTEKEMGLVALDGKDYLLSQSCFERLKILGDPREARELLLGIEKKRSAVEIAQIQRIRKIMKALQSPPPQGMAEEYVSEILQMKGSHTVKELISFLSSPYLWQRMVSIESLGKMGDRHSQVSQKDASWWLFKILQQKELWKDLEEIEALVWALGRLKYGRANTFIYELRMKSGQTSAFWEKTKTPFQWIPFDEEDSPKTAEEWKIRGNIKIDKEDYRGALEDFAQALKLQPDFAEAYGNCGVVHQFTGQFQEALEDYNKAIGLKPDFAKFYSNRGNVYRSLKNYSLALADYTKAIQLKSDFLEAYFNRANLFSAWGNTSMAISDYSKAIQLKSDFVAAYTNRGNLYFHKRQYPQAIADFTSSIQLNPTYSEAYYNRGNVYRLVGNFEKALEDYASALKIFPRYADVYNNRGVLHHALKNHDKALVDFTRALELKLNLPQTYCNRAMVFVALNKLDQAIQDYTSALELQPKRITAYYSRGVCFFQQKKYDLALQDFQQILKIAPQVPDRKEIEEWIDKCQNRKRNP